MTAWFRKRYGAVLGSAVNPVLREGNSDRRCAPPVKEQVSRSFGQLVSLPVASWAVTLSFCLSVCLVVCFSWLVGQLIQSFSTSVSQLVSQHVGHLIRLSVSLSSHRFLYEFIYFSPCSVISRRTYVCITRYIPLQIFL